MKRNQSINDQIREGGKISSVLNKTSNKKLPQPPSSTNQMEKNVIVLFA